MEEMPDEMTDEMPEEETREVPGKEEKSRKTREEYLERKGCRMKGAQERIQEEGIEGKIR